MRDFRHYHATPIKAIRAFCVHCMGFQTHEVSKCTAMNCPLFPYRMGKRPAHSQCIGLKESLKIAEKNGS